MIISRDIYSKGLRQPHVTPTSSQVDLNSRYIIFITEIARGRYSDAVSLTDDFSFRRILFGAALVQTYKLGNHLSGICWR